MFQNKVSLENTLIAIYVQYLKGYDYTLPATHR